MNVILQDALPEEMAGQSALPGVAPCAPDDWLRVDEAYAGQMARKLALLDENRAAVVWLDAAARAAAVELLEQVLEIAPSLGFACSGNQVKCPDGRVVDVDRADPMGTLARLVQEDLCILEKQGEEHVLTGAALCFPASWSLAEKAGKPLIAIHAPVPEYDETLARRVQRLFDGVKPQKPLWRFNKLFYADPELHQPRSMQARRTLPAPKKAPFIRSERQCILRMPKTNAVVFSIHTYVVAR